MLKNKEQIIINGEDKTDRVSACIRNGNKIEITFLDGQTYRYNADKVQIRPSALSNATALHRFKYLKKIAETISLSDPEGGNILLNRYNKIDFVSQESMLAVFLTGVLKNIKQITTTPIFPFGFNISQKSAVDKAMENTLSIIEGPPGTGKTQTILNIIANAIMNGESVAVVSNNNSATFNVFEKLEKYGFNFIAACLGNADNKQEFINSQKPLPNLTPWKLTVEEENKIKKTLQSLYTALNDTLLMKNELSKLRSELNSLELEHKHFVEYCDYNDKTVSLYLKPTSSTKALQLWFLCEKYIERNKMPGFFGRIINRLKYGVKNKTFYSDPEMMIALCQKRWYRAKINELTEPVSTLQKDIDNFDFTKKMKDYSSLSAKLFRNKLANKYKNTERTKFKLEDLWRNAQKVISEYPVILSTTYSLRSSLNHTVMYDYVIIDESSQVDIATGALALSCARKGVIVGDQKQLPNVVDRISARVTDDIFHKFKLPESYRYKTHSLLLSISEMFPTAPKTFLHEHYRCHPQIIEFCNKKFYNNQLIVLTENKFNKQPLILYKTTPGNHARSNINQRQIDVIKNEIIPQQTAGCIPTSIGIVTPYRNQTNELQRAFAKTGIQADTVDKFQGREKEIVILSTVDNKITEFADNANRLNVAVSRAIEQLIVIVNGGDEAIDKNIGDLMRYIQYNNLEIVNSEIYSVFDYLYKCYSDKRKEFLRNKKKISEYDSENLMYNLICDVLNMERFRKFDVSVHVPLRMILRNLNKLEANEKLYAANSLTHVDFLIFEKLGKTPRLIVEVDGASFHAKGTRQAERDILKNRILEKYNLPFIRFETTGSREQELLELKLNEIMASS
ncbi:superfamily I DNA and/or RNA helicase [Elusimicrobium simillimum]|uniref:AAA domain-containing protein n=1 Tax=Elusimicrobium simillimum TaxID=3143438 RepID=UPI003C703F53